VTGVTLDKASMTLILRAADTLTANVMPANAADKTVTWSSSNTGVAAVSAAGVVTAIGRGEAIITVRTADGDKTASCAVSVRFPSRGIFQPGKVSLTQYARTSLTVSVPNAASLKLSSSNSRVIAVEGNELVFVGTGKATVKAAYRLNNSSKAVTVARAITVKSKAESINVYVKGTARADATIARRGKVTLSAVIAPSDATNKAVTWSSSNKAIATVTGKGVVTGVKAGTAAITAKSKDGGYISRAVITVTPIYETSVKLNKGAVSLNKGKTFQLKATLSPSSTDFKAVKWSTGDASVATVSSKGLVRAVNTGTVTITVTSVNGRTAICRVTVKPQKVTAVKMSAAAAAQRAGTMIRLTATAAPSNADNRAVIWSTSNAAVATVDQSGNVSFLKPGKVTIRAIAADGSNKSAYRVFTVK
jgi:uncharacterized protein YjdB